MIINEEYRQYSNGTVKVVPIGKSLYTTSAQDSYYCNNFNVYFISITPNLPKDFDLANLIPDDVIRKMLDKKLMIGFEFYLESHPELVDAIYRAIIKHGWPETQILIIQPGGEDFKQYILNKAIFSSKLPINYEYFNSVEKMTKQHFIKQFNFSQNTLPNISSPLLKSNHAKKFINLNFTQRDHRIATVLGLKDKGLLDQGYVSFTKYKDESRWENDLNYISNVFNVGHNQKHFVRELPLVLDLTNEASRWPAFNTRLLFKYHQDTYLSLITETWWHSESMFHCTEKTFKAMFYKHPFIMVSTRGFLRNLRKLGYKTFHGIIDESYDTEPDSATRMGKILNEMVRICNFNEHQLQDFKNRCLPIVEHNFKMFMTKSNYITRMI